MVHPAVILGICAGGVVVGIVGYAGYMIYAEWQEVKKEQREYADFLRVHTEKERVNSESEEDEENDHDDVPLGMWDRRKSSFYTNSELRQRKAPFYKESSVPSYEDLERSISSRKSYLEKEKEILEQEEAELERRRSILQSKGNSITGVFSDSDHESIIYQPIESKQKQAISNESLHIRQHTFGSDQSWSDLEQEKLHHKRSNSEESFEHVSPT